MDEAPDGSQAGPPLPLSENLKLLCLFDKGDQDGAFGPRHLVILGWRVTGQLHLDTLRQAATDVVARHEILRTTIVRDADPPHMRVRPPAAPQVEVRTIPVEGWSSTDEAVDAFINEVETTQLSVHAIPHLKLVVGRLDPTDAVVVLVTHHTASDGWSLHVIMRDLARYYAARRASDPARLPEVRQYHEYAVWQEADAAAPRTAAARCYWRRTLDGAQMLDIRADRRLPTDAAGVYAVHRNLFDGSVSTAVVGFARTMRCSPFMVLSAAFVALLHRLTGATDVVSPVITSGRNEPAFQDTVGPFFNLMPIRTSLHGCDSFAELVGRVRTRCLEAFEHELPFGAIVAESATLMRTYERDDGAVCTLQVLQFPDMTEPERIGDLHYAEVRRRSMSYPTTSDIPNGVLWALDLLGTGEIAGTLRYNSLQFDAATMHGLVDAYAVQLRRGLADPHGRWSGSTGSRLDPMVKPPPK